MLNPNTLPIKHVKVDGVFNRLSQTEVKKNVVENIQGGFFNIDVDKVRVALLNMPWVRDVTVKRVWPDSLKVVVSEQVPSARWGDLGLLNELGEFFSPDDMTITNDLPFLWVTIGLDNFTQGFVGTIFVKFLRKKKYKVFIPKKGKYKFNKVGYDNTNELILEYKLIDDDRYEDTHIIKHYIGNYYYLSYHHQLLFLKY